MCVCGLPLGVIVVADCCIGAVACTLGAGVLFLALPRGRAESSLAHLLTVLLLPPPPPGCSASSRLQAVLMQGNVQPASQPAMPGIKATAVTRPRTVLDMIR